MVANHPQSRFVGCISRLANPLGETADATDGQGAPPLLETRLWWVVWMILVWTRIWESASRTSSAERILPPCAHNALGRILLDHSHKDHQIHHLEQFPVSQDFAWSWKRAERKGMIWNNSSAVLALVRVIVAFEVLLVLFVAVVVFVFSSLARQIALVVP